MTTLKDIARDLDLSVTQVSRALNDHADVSPATKQRVHAAADRLGYHPNLTARRLRSGRSGLVAMVVPGLEDTAEREMLMETVMGLSSEFSRRGVQFVLHVLSAGEDPARAHERLVRGGAVDGVIVTDPLTDDPRIEVLSRLQTPFVVHGRDRRDAQYSFVDLDHPALGGSLAAGLLTQGYRRIAWVGGPPDRLFDRLRRQGIEETLAAAGLALDPALVFPGRMTVARGAEVAPLLLAAGADAAIAGNMMLASGLRAALPDLPIAAHDDGLHGFAGDRIGPPLFRTRAPLSDAWAPLCDALVAAVGREAPRRIVLPHAIFSAA